MTKGSAAEALSLNKAHRISNMRDLDLVALDDALIILAEMSEQQSRIVELRFLVGYDKRDRGGVASIARDGRARLESGETLAETRHRKKVRSEELV